MEQQTFPGTLDALEPLREYVKEAARSAGLDQRAIYKLCLAVDEIATNVVCHGYEEAGLNGDLKIEASIKDDSLVIQLEDRAKPYDPNLHDVPNTDDLLQPLDEREIGGLGILLAQDGVDDLQYTATNEGNVHRFIIHLPQNDTNR